MFNSPVDGIHAYRGLGYKICSSAKDKSSRKPKFLEVIDPQKYCECPILLNTLSRSGHSAVQHTTR